jgi:cytochrome d ubiquinol oxidase subunit I
MVAIGTFISRSGSCSVNSWMQTPDRLRAQRRRQFVPRGAGPRSSSIPSFPYRLVHYVIAAYLTDGAVVVRWAAWHLLRPFSRAHSAQDVLDGDVDGGAGRAVQIFVGDLHGLNTLEHQPAKSWR